MLRVLMIMFALPLFPSLVAAASPPVIHYRFDAAPRLEGSESARLSLDGKTGFIEVQGAENLHLGPKGLSVLATVRFTPATDPGPNDVDMILFKEREFLIGRMGDKPYFNLHDGTDWKSHVLVGPLPRGEWCHVAVIETRQFDNGQMGLVFLAQQPTPIGLCGLYDFAARRELLGRQRPLWALHYAPAASGQTQRLDSVSPSLAASLSVDHDAERRAMAFPRLSPN